MGFSGMSKPGAVGRDAGSEAMKGNGDTAIHQSRRSGQVPRGRWLHDRARHIATWNSTTWAYLEQVQAVLASMRDYWPLTLRQLYYRLVGAEIIANNLREYKKLSRVLTKARLQKLVEPRAIEDRSRSMVQWPVYPSADDFVAESKDAFLTGYRRDLLQTQPVAWEIWVEKDALVNMCSWVAVRYGLPVVVAKGYSSISFLIELSARIRSEWSENDRPVGIIYLGDFDPSGMNMLPTMEHTLKEEMEIPDGSLRTIRCALNPDHVSLYKLPHSPDAVKMGDTRAKEFIEQYGEIAVELDALPPDVLMHLLDEAIRQELDLTEYKKECQRQSKDENYIATFRDQVLGAIDDF